MTVIEFPDYATAKPWLQVLHDGEQDGVGRRRWKPEQKARATSNKSTDALAVAILDYAEREGIISDDIRQGVQVSTATRYLANPSVRRAMGLASPATSTKILISGGTDRFAKVLTNFFDGIRSKKLHSRSVTADWNGYADELNASFGIPPEDIQPSDVTQPAARPSSTPLRSSSRPTRARIVTPETRFIAKSATVIAALNKLDSYKLSNLYNSLTSLRLDENPVLLTAGAWVFVETLTALHGKTPSTDFVSYLNGRFASLGVGKDQAKDCKLCLEYISQNGNAGKHSGRYAAVDARNLNNHFHVLEPVFVALLDQCPNEQ